MKSTETPTPLTIRRFELQHVAAQEVEMPGGAHIVNIRTLPSVVDLLRPCPIYLWAIVKADAPAVKRVFYIYKTDEPLNPPPQGKMLINVGSVPDLEGQDLDHIFEIIDEPRQHR